jgi:hypothetical protein
MARISLPKYLWIVIGIIVVISLSILFITTTETSSTSARSGEYYGEYSCGDAKSIVRFTYDAPDRKISNFSYQSTCPNGSVAGSFSYTDDTLSVTEDGKIKRLLPSGQSVDIGHIKSSRTMGGEVDHPGFNFVCSGNPVKVCLQWTAEAR